MRYFHIPVVFPEMKDEQVAEFLKITDEVCEPACDYSLHDGGEGGRILDGSASFAG